MSGMNLVPATKKNVGGYDRIARVVGGLVLLAVGVAVLSAGQTWLAALSAVAAVGLFFNAATQFCGINAMLGIDTCAGDSGEC